MTDENQNCIVHELSDSQVNDTQLRYPQLLIEASFESLLSHSHSSGSRTIVDVPVTKMSLSESWSSLSENDLSHDDDLHSEVTDTGSLIDISTAEDVHSVNDRGDASDDDQEEEDEDYDRPEDTRDQDREQCRQPIFRASGDIHEMNTNSFSYSSADSRQYIKLNDSVTQTSTEGLQVLQASKTFTDTELRSSSIQSLPWEDSETLTGTINMTMSQENFQLGQKPFHILYHGPELSPPEIKSDVLGKIGAALISSGSQHVYGEHSETPCFHIVPSEFGPGSRPSTADLIPIPVQMHVSDCVVLGEKSESAPDSSIRLQIGNGTSILSRPARFSDIGAKQQWALPDLVVIVISQTESENDRLEASRVLEFSKRHNIGNICLRHGSGWNGDGFLANSSPNMLHEHLECHQQGKCVDDGGRKMLVDIDTFLNLDSEQLNRHLQYLTSSANLKALVHEITGSHWTRHFIDTCRQNITPYLKYLPGSFANIGSGNADNQGWALEIIPPQASQSRTNAGQEKKATIPTTVHSRKFALSLMYRVMLSILFTAFTTFTIYYCSTMMPQLLGSNKTANQETILGRTDIGVKPSHPLSVPVVSTEVATIPQTFALSGPLQVLEQQVQNWMPLQSFKEKKATQHDASETKSGSRGGASAAKQCHSIVPAHFSPSIKVDQSFFCNKSPEFTFRVERDGVAVPAKLEKKSRRAVIKIKRKDSYGRLTVHLQTDTKATCAYIDLENSISGAFTLWNNSLRKQKFKSARRLGNEYTPLLLVRKAEPGFISGALELHHSAAKGLGAAIEAVEKSAMKHAKTCYEHNEQCLIPKLHISKQEISESAQQIKDRSLALIHYAHEQISSSAKQAKNRANGIGEKATGEVSKAVQVVQSSMGGLSLFSRELPGRVTETLAEAQKRAQKMMQMRQLRRAA